MVNLNLMTTYDYFGQDYKVDYKRTQKIIQNQTENKFRYMLMKLELAYDSQLPSLLVVSNRIYKLEYSRNYYPNTTVHGNTV